MAAAKKSALLRSAQTQFSGSGMSALESLDARGLLCPLPVIRTQDRIRNLSVGTLLEVIATDPGVLQDIPAWCRVHGHELVTADTVDNDAGEGLVYRFHIRVSEA